MLGWGSAIKGVTDLVSEFVEDKDKANELETQIKAKLLNIEQEVWDLLKLGIGGYIAGRSGEKIVESYAKNRS